MMSNDMDSAFAAYKLPSIDNLHLVMQHKTGLQHIGFSHKIEAEGFMMLPFCCTLDKPMLIIKADERIDGHHEVLSAMRDIMPALSSMPDTEADHYHDAFVSALDALQNHRLSKIVMSSCSYIKTRIDAVALFEKACERYPRMMVYMCYTPVTGLWMGCSPEMIMDGKGNEWTTVALAGTQPVVDNRLPMDWDLKNRREQRIVADYIRQVLDDKALKVNESNTYIQRAGDLAHLRTDFTFSLGNPAVETMPLLGQLFPTPAVCGLPKEQAYDFINRHEGYDRGYYAGVIGPLGEDETHLYVNLRCARIYADGIRLFAGGGLLKESVEGKEAEEIRQKMNTIGSLIDK